MLLYNSMNPDKDYIRRSSPPPRTDIANGEYLELITEHHYRHTRPLFQALENNGIILGNGLFCISMISFSDSSMFLPLECEQYYSLAEAVKTHIHTPVALLYSACGALYLLMGYPRLTEEDLFAHQAEYLDTIRQMHQRLYDDVCLIYPHIHFLISTMMPQEESIFMEANSLRHSLEYYKFASDWPPVVYIDLESSLHRSMINDLDTYRNLSFQCSKLLTDRDTDVEVLSKRIADEILSHSATTMESLHHHAQIFMLTFTDCLKSFGIVNAQFIESKEIVRRIMRFEKEEEFRKNLSLIIKDLKKQYFTLSSVGKKERILEVRNTIVKHICEEDLSLASLADQLDISPSLLTKQFSQYLGITIYQFIKEERLHYTQQFILDHPSMPLHEVAAQCGYSNFSTMHRAFKQMSGITPGHFKAAAAVDAKDR